MTQTTQTVIPHTAPETQKVHIRLAQLEVNTGIKNLRDRSFPRAQFGRPFSDEDKEEPEQEPLPF